MTIVGAEAAVPALTGLRPISLEDLIEYASLQIRVDRKYVLPLEAVDALVQSLGHEGAHVLEMTDQRSFAYESLYYDTSRLTSYLMAARGRRRRFKVRRRSYLEWGTAFLEVKTRGTRGVTVKKRIPLAAQPRDVLGNEAQDFIDEELQRAGIREAAARDLQPTLHSRYLRSTLVLPTAACRVTIDSRLSWSLVGDEELHLCESALVETKSERAASVADRLLWAAGCRPRRISKYGTGLALLRPDLPSNRWHSVLQRHLRLTP
jgi:hypothetical protein